MLLRSPHRLAVPLLVLLLSVFVAAPALATKPGGKNPLGEVVSFDSATRTLSVRLNDGQTATATVAPDVQVKLEHRGNHARGKGHGNPSNGSVEDLVPGADVLRWKLEEGVLTKVRLRPVES